MSVDAEVRAIRRSAGLSRVEGWTLLRAPLEAALSTVDPRVATNLELREAQLRQALALDDAGRPRLDLLVGAFRGELLVLADGPNAEGVLGIPSSAEPPVIFGLDGPFAWEVLGAWDTPTAIGLPYLSLYAPRDGLLVIRAGRSGEYGYWLLVPRAEADAVWADLERRVREMDGAVVGAEALRRCAFENWVFDLAADGAHGLDALELQLTWRLDLKKDATGLDAIRAHRDAGLRRRILAIRAAGPLAPGATVQYAGQPIGTVLRASDRHAVAVLDRPSAEVGLDVTIDGTPARTVSAPFVLNRSLFVNPQRHAWATRHEVEIPEGLGW